MLRIMFTAVCCSISVAVSTSAAPLDVGARKQLFIDQRFIAQSDGIVLTANPAQKLGLVLDENGNKFYDFVSRVMEDQGKIRLYVGADSLSVMESKDGMHFRRVGTIPSGRFPTLFDDPHEANPARRYKLFWLEFALPFDPEKHGVYAAYSGDGLNFTTVGRVLPYFTDNPPLVYWDQRIGKYVIYTRAFEQSSENQRRVGRLETDDPLAPWPHTKSENDTMWFTPRNVQVVLSADREDNPHSDIYYNACTFYPWGQDVYLMFTAQFRHFSPERNPYIRPRVPGQWEDFGFLEVQLAVSRDGIAWERPGRDPYFPTGLADEWDRWYAVMAPGLAKRGNYFYQYYVSSGRTHDSIVIRPEYDGVPEDQLGGIGAVRQRLDGFVSADADFHGGWLDTPLMTFEGQRLRLNIDTGAMGTAFIEVRDETGVPIPGFALADCEEIGGNFIDQAVYWKGSSDVSGLQGRAISLHIALTRGKLYAFQFTKE